MNRLVFYTYIGIQASMVNLSNLSAVRFSGADAGSFLHGQLSADVLGLASGGVTFACYCEPKGRVLALMLVHSDQEAYHVIMSAALATAVTERLKIYRMRSKVEIEILAGHSVLGLVEGDGTGWVPELSMPLPDSKRRLAVSAGRMSADPEESLRQAWKYAELQMGICWLSAETSAQFLPQMLGFVQLGAVNYRKGCYPGQEIVARTHYLGKVKRHPRLLDCRLSACPRPMDRIDIWADGKAHEAVVADCARGQDGMIRLLAVTRMEPEASADRVQYEGETVILSRPS
jgi:folate-binding protein YgfZ